MQSKNIVLVSTFRGDMQSKKILMSGPYSSYLDVQVSLWKTLYKRDGQNISLAINESITRENLTQLVAVRESGVNVRFFTYEKISHKKIFDFGYPELDNVTFGPIFRINDGGIGFRDADEITIISSMKFQILHSNYKIENAKTTLLENNFDKKRISRGEFLNLQKEFFTTKKIPRVSCECLCFNNYFHTLLSEGKIQGIDREKFEQ